MRIVLTSSYNGKKIEDTFDSLSVSSHPQTKHLQRKKGRFERHVLNVAHIFPDTNNVQAKTALSLDILPLPGQE